MTIAAWIVLGVVAGLLSRIAMPVFRDRGNLPAVFVGVCSACIGGGLGAVFLGGDLLLLNAMSIAWSAIAALYILFAYRCLVMRGN